MIIQEWLFFMGVVGAGTVFANFIGFQVPLAESLPGISIMILIALCAAAVKHFVPLNLPTVAYCSIFGLLLACPVSPCADYVISAVAKINFTTPLTMVGAYAGMSISNQLKTFVKQGWRYVIITMLVMTGTFFGSLVVAQVVLRLTHAI